MFYKGIIFDLDNTIYSYDTCHNKAIHGVFNYIIQNGNESLSVEYIKNIYENISRKLKCELHLTASTHNKSICFKQLLEKLNIHLSLFSKINTIYWDLFYKNMSCYEGIIDFLIFNKNIGKKIGILTDYETEYQILKLEHLSILKYVDIIVTSEEVGIEKPSNIMFTTILNKLNMTYNEVIMIGDNFEKDIQGAINMNIFAYWFNPKETNTFFKNYNIFNCFKNLHNNFNDINNELIYLKNISKYCGERFDLVQAGGGNISVKIDNLMFIKASGYNLTNIDEGNGYVVINNKLVLEDIRNNNDVRDIIGYNFIGNKRGSIETFMHSILKKYTIHLHPIQINRILISDNSREIVKQVYPSGLIIDYFTPGIKVCNEINKYYHNHDIIFLLNHGIIVTADDINNVYLLIEDVISKFEKYQNINFEKYKTTNKISNIINTKCNLLNVTYLCEDKIINDYFLKKRELFKMKISFPDALIYCGVKILFCLNDIDDYIKSFNESPKIIIENDLIYMNSHNIQKCKEIEDVFKSNIMILDTDFDKIFLSFKEICFLNNWDSEKYRKNL
jgi:HAD superfamily hydrolase (TIGR01549 family)